MENSTLRQNHTVQLEELAWYYLPSVLAVPPLGLPANALVMRLLLGKPGICSTSEIFILNLALFDALFCLIFLCEYLLFLCTLTIESSDFAAWGLNQAGGPMLLCLLSVDSFMAVCHPMVFLRLKDPRLRLGLCAAVSGVAACCIVKVSARIRWTMVMVVMFTVITAMMTYNVLILMSLRQSGPGGKKLHPVKRRAFKTVLTMLVLVYVHYLPPVVEYVLKQLLPSRFFPFSYVSLVSCFSLTSTSVVQPLCYLVRTNQLPRLGCGGSA